MPILFLQLILGLSYRSFLSFVSIILTINLSIVSTFLLVFGILRSVLSISNMIDWKWMLSFYSHFLIIVVILCLSLLGFVQIVIEFVLIIVLSISIIVEFIGSIISFILTIVRFVFIFVCYGHRIGIDCSNSVGMCPSILLLCSSIVPLVVIKTLSFLHTHSFHLCISKFHH
jgi:hypothetical protein